MHTTSHYMFENPTERLFLFTGIPLDSKFMEWKRVTVCPYFLFPMNDVEKKSLGADDYAL